MSADWGPFQTIHMLMGRCSAGLNLLASAEESFAKAAEFLSEDPDPVPAFEEQLWRLRAKNLASNLHFEQAVENYTKALKIHPENLESLRGRAFAYAGALDEQGYQKDLASVQKIDPKAADVLKEQAEKMKSLSQNAEGLTILGLDKLRAREHSAAIALFNQAIKKDPKFHLAYEKKGSSLQSLKQYDKAIEAYSKSYQLQPTEVSLFNRANCYIKIGEKEKAKADFQEFIKISKSPREIEMAKILIKGL